MLCFYCGNEIHESENRCPYCGVSLTAYKDLVYMSNSLYNEGLDKAKVRDLSGAIDSLSESLKCNKYNTNARNLLGLCYFEMGDMVMALSEWVISKNLQPGDNIVDTYLSEVQNAGTLDKLNNTIRKYNQAIEYCKQGSRDLAKIQLRRVLGINPKLVKGHQLLALLCMQDGDYDEARKALNEAAKIDVKNTTTLRYIQEVKAVLKEQNANSKKKRKKDTYSFQDGNDTIVMPRNNRNSFVDNSHSGLVNIAIGAILGVLIIGFLIIPTIQQNANNDAANSLVSANEELATSTGSIENLKTQLDELNAELDQYKDKAGVEDSYELVLKAYTAYTQNGDLDTASKYLSNVNSELLGDSGLYIYNAISDAANNAQAQTLYDEANTAYWSKDYQTAVEKYTAVVELLPDYDNGAAIYYLADSYSGLWDFDNAITYYQQYLTAYPDGYFANQCQTKIDSINEATGGSSN